MCMMGGFISSQLACRKCSNYDHCLDTAMDHPELDIKCIHFGYIQQLTDDAIKMVQEQMNEYIDEYLNNLFGRKEN